MPKVTKKTRPTKKTVESKASGRKTVYPAPEVRLLKGKDAITLRQAKDLLGWEEEGEEKFGDDYVHEIRSVLGRKVRCRNNITNRPLTVGTVLKLKQEILRGRWQFNGENRIIGRTGLVLNGQHTLIALIAAAEEWAEHPDKWSTWEQEPSIDTTIAFGVDESDEVVNTMDTCKPRSLAEVLYRSRYFDKLKNRDRRACSGILDYAIKMLWHRTGASMDAFGLRRTHSESLDFLSRHPRILQCVSHVYEEDGRGKEGRKLLLYATPGCLSALMYLMGCCYSDHDTYYGAESPAEALLDWKAWDKASDFVVLLAAKAKEILPLRKTIAAAGIAGSISRDEQWALLAKAWLCYVDKKPITESSLSLKYRTDEDGLKTLIECPTVGGIDLGEPLAREEETISGPAAKDPTPEEIQERKKTEKKRKVQAAFGIPRRAGDAWAKGDIAWVREEGGDEPYLAQLTEDPEDCDDGDQVVLVNDGAACWEVSVRCMSLEKPVKKPTAVKKFPRPPKPGKGKETKTPTLKVGMTKWIVGLDPEPWRGKIVELSKKAARVKVDQGFQGTGTIKVVPLGLIRDIQPCKEKTVEQE